MHDFDAHRAAIDGFVDRHFTWPGTWRLHGAALGLDILRAPVNVVLSPVLLLTRIVAALFQGIGWQRAADGLRRRRILLRTAVAARVETLIVTDLLNLPMPAGTSDRDPTDLHRAILAAPQFREAIRKSDSVPNANALAARLTAALSDYSGTRSAVAEITTSVLVLVVGGLLFQAITPGMVSMAPGIADAVARHQAISDFALGTTLGGVWYSAFPVGVPGWMVGGIIAALVMCGSVIAAFAGVLADPVQARLGIHRRRLRRLVATLESELRGPGGTPFVAKEHLYARLMDLGDVAASILRFIRG